MSAKFPRREGEGSRTFFFSLKSIISSCDVSGLRPFVVVFSFVLMLYVPINNLSLVGTISRLPAKQWIFVLCLAHGHNTMTSVILEIATL